MDFFAKQKLENAEVAGTTAVPEVKIRTMRGDMESASHVGGPPQFQSVKAPNLSPYGSAPQSPAEIESNAAEVLKVGFSMGDEAQQPSLPARAGKDEGNTVAEVVSKNFLTIALIAVLALAVLAVVVYMGYTMFFGGATTPAPQTPSTNNAQNQVSGVQSPAGQPAQNQTQAGTGFTHVTFFRKPVDQTLKLNLSNSVESAADLQTFSQRFSGLFPASKSTSTFFGVDVKNADGSDAQASEVFAAADTAVLDPQYVSAHFNPDITVFAYKDANGLWPGYIVQLKFSDNWLYLKDEVAKLETKQAQIDNFFLSPHGAPDAKGFQDDSNGFRKLAYSSPGAVFVYVWLRGYLIFGTSIDGMNQAISRL
jgi:flagellar basal body-associated protein FliL